jgi:hypothetical protein
MLFIIHAFNNNIINNSMKELYAMKKAKSFLMKKGLDKDEAEINKWLAQNPQIKVLGMAGTYAALTIIYEE